MSGAPCRTCGVSVEMRPGEDSSDFRKRICCGRRCAALYRVKLARERLAASGVSRAELDSRKFWSKVDRATSPDGCWLWTDARDRNGYGSLRVDGGKVRAHRFSLALSGVVVPDDRLVCHRCDNPPCVNPAHLFLGSLIDNRADCVSKIRHARGEDHGRAKLSADDVVEMRRLHASGVRADELAHRFGMSKTQTYTIVQRKQWRHV